MTDTASSGRIIVIGGPARAVEKAPPGETAGCDPSPQEPLAHRQVVIKDGVPVADEGHDTCLGLQVCVN